MSNTWVVCPECDGAGLIKVAGLEVECPECDGRGQIKSEGKQQKFYTYKDVSRK